MIQALKVSHVTIDSDAYLLILSCVVYVFSALSM